MLSWQDFKTEMAELRAAWKSAVAIAIVVASGSSVGAWWLATTVYSERIAILEERLKQAQERGVLDSRPGTDNTGALVRAVRLLTNDVAVDDLPFQLKPTITSRADTAAFAFPIIELENAGTVPLDAVIVRLAIESMGNGWEILTDGSWQTVSKGDIGSQDVFQKRFVQLRVGERRDIGRIHVETPNYFSAGGVRVTATVDYGAQAAKAISFTVSTVAPTSSQRH